jgi:membrane AbrB-like protein
LQAGVLAKEVSGVTFHFPSLKSRGLGTQWAILLAVSALLVFVLERLHLPAAPMLGPMIAGILLAAARGTVRVPGTAFILAQGVIGCMVARVIRPSLIGDVVADWPLFLVAVLSVIAASAALGWLLARWRVLPGSTVVWGSFPGAATAMVLMAEAYGADVRLVAFMQYLRVVFVASTASIVARAWAMGGRFANVSWFPPITPLLFFETLGLAWGGALGAQLLRIPAGPLLLPLVLGAVLQDSKLMTIDLPPWLLAASYAVIGWSIGLRFTRPILIYAARALPRVVAAILTLIAVCALFSVGLAALAKVDPMTAYLAMSPGGADSVAIIAASSTVDVPFVMALQTARFVVVLAIGPWLARLIARRAGYEEIKK